MLPVTHGTDFTQLHVLLYTMVLFATTLLPFVCGMSGLIYLAAPWCWAPCFSPTRGRSMAPLHRRSGAQDLPFSIVYLSLLFAALLVDHYCRDRKPA